ncbi:MAG: hypothetical protein HKM87_03100 [Ignavibacteriaceae bacterium]|nr:hypothetical protein [Ignavibacteriaceae bacterium]
MKILKILLLFFIAVTLLTGCFKVETIVKINKDGSGTIFQTVMMSKTFVEMISQFADSFSDSSGTEDFSLFNEEEFIESAKEFGSGVQYVRGEPVIEDGWEGFIAEYEFDDLNKIRLEPEPDNKISIGKGEQDVEEENAEYYFFKFINGDIPEVIIDRPEIETDFDDEEIEIEGSDDEFNDEFLKMMDGMKVDVAVEFDGKIVETNATHVEDSSVTLLSVDFGEMIKNKETLEMMKKNQPDKIEDFEAFVEKIPGMKLELKKPVSVKFK